MYRALALLVALSALAGAPLAEAAGWRLPETPEAGGGFVTNPAVGVGARGDVVVAWESSTGVIQATVRPPGGTFVRVGPDLSQPGAASPQVGVDASGASLVAWMRDGIVQVAERPAGGAFGGPTDLPGSGPGAQLLQLNVGDVGRALAVWRSNFTFPMSFSVDSAFRPATGGFGPAMFESGNVAVDAWEQDFTGNRRGDVAMVKFVRSFGAFPPPPRFKIVAIYSAADGGEAQGLDLAAATFTDEPAEHVRVAVGESGDTAAVWRRPESPVGLRASVGLAAPAALPGTGAGSFAPAIAVDAAGGVLVLWAESGALRSAFRPRGGDFGPPQAVPGGGPPVNDLHVVFLANGDALAVWQVNGRILAARRPAGGVFQAAEPISPVGTFAELPRLAVDDAGDAVVTWDQEQGGNYAIGTAVYDGGAPELRGLVVPAAGTAGLPLAFEAAPFDRFSPAAVEWDFGDGGTAALPQTTHTFAVPGSYTVTATASDAASNQGNVEARTVLVSSIDAPPPQCGELRIPRAIRKKLARASRLARRGLAAKSRPKKKTRSLERASRLLGRALVLVDKAERRGRQPLSAECATALRTLVAGTKAGVDAAIATAAPSAQAGGTAFSHAGSAPGGRTSG